MTRDDCLPWSFEGDIIIMLTTADKAAVGLTYAIKNDDFKKIYSY